MKSKLADPLPHAEPLAVWMAEPSAAAQPPTRHERIAAAAYRRAEERGFAPGAELDDWLQAEREIDVEDAGED
jgi:hypothetical protein